MTKKVNKHITDSEELFRRLETGDENGLDDFEKEALEGFDSLENTRLAKDLHEGLNNRIESTYFKKEAKGNSFWYLAMAAGLVLVLGLSILFYNYLGKAQDLALKEESALTETELKPSDMGNAETNTGSKITEEKEVKSAEEPPPPPSVYSNTLQNQPAEKKAKLEEPKLNSRSIIRNQPPSKNGPPSNNFEIALVDKTSEQPAAPIVTADEQKNTNTVADLEKATAYTSSPAMDKLAEEGLKQQIASGGKRDESKKEEYSKSKKTNAAPNKSAPAEMQSEGRASDELTTIAANKAVSGSSSYNQKGEDDRSNSDEKTATRSITHYSTAQEFIKSELEKNPDLKAKVKEFKANLTIESNGIVSKVVVLTEFKDCSFCEANLKNLLMNLPAEQGTKLKGKKGKDKNTVELVYP